MFQFERFGRFLRLFLLVGMVGLTGCQDGNLFGKLHDSGDSGDTQSLLSDAEVALNNGDYAGALALYTRILDGDSDNALALYGSAVANAGLSGLNLGQLLANVLNDDGSLQVSSLGDAIHSASRGVGILAAAPNSIVYKLVVNLNTLREAGDQLLRIARGDTDGSIPKDDMATLVDLAMVDLVYYTYKMIHADVFDIINENGRLKFVSKGGAAAYCGSGEGQIQIQSAGRALCDVYAVLKRAANKAGPKATLLTKFRDDVDQIIEEGLDGDSVNDLDAACRTALDFEGINASTFRTFSSLN